MKKIHNILLATLVLTSFAMTSAKADEPKGTYAVVNSSGVVTNIIVCTESVCGANGSWHGVMPSDTPCPGCSIVLQVPPNPVTGQSQGGNMGTPENPVTYNSQTQLFTQGTTSAPSPVVRSEVVDATILTAIINSTAVTFTPNNTINGQLQVTPVVDSTTSATISASVDGMTQSQTLSTPQTVEQLEQRIQSQTLLQRRMSRWIYLLRGFLIE